MRCYVFSRAMPAGSVACSLSAQETARIVVML